MTTLLLCGLFACGKDEETKVYTIPESKTFNIVSDSSVTDLKLESTFYIGNQQVNDISYENKTVITYDLNGEFWAYKTDGTALFNEAFITYTKNGNLYSFVNNINSYLYNAKTGVITNLGGANVTTLKDNWYATKSSANLYLEIFDENGEHVAYIFDEESDLNLIKCDKYILYLNVKLEQYQIFDLNESEIVKEYPNSTGMNVFYICQGKFLICEQLETTSGYYYYNEVYNAQNDTAVQLSSTNYSAVYNEYNTSTIQIKQPYSVYISYNGSFLIMNDDFSHKIELDNPSVYFIDDYAAVNLYTTKRENTSVLYKNTGLTVQSVMEVENTVEMYYNDEAIVYGAILDSEIKFAAKKIDGTQICEAIYYDISMFYEGKALASTYDSDTGFSYFLIDKSGSATPVLKNIVSFTTGMYWYKENGKLIFEDFDGNKLVEVDENSTITQVIVSQDSRVIVVANTLYIL